MKKSRLQIKIKNFLKLFRIKIGLIGYGNMGSAIAKRMAGIYVFDIDKLKTKDIKDTVKEVLNAEILVQKSDIIILAVKPQDFGVLLESISKVTAGSDKLFISIAAGITTGYIEKTLGNVRVIRAMPNNPGKIGAGVTCLCAGKFATEEDLDLAEKIFDYLGEVVIIKEELMNAATAISGSGPGYVCHYIDSNKIDINNIPEEKITDFLRQLENAAVKIGFDPDTAEFLVKNTYSGTIKSLKQTGISAQELKNQVTSKGGTTEAALSSFSKNGSWEEAVIAALRRAEEISRTLSS